MIRLFALVLISTFIGSCAVIRTYNPNGNAIYVEQFPEIRMNFFAEMVPLYGTLDCNPIDGVWLVIRNLSSEYLQFDFNSDLNFYIKEENNYVEFPQPVIYEPGQTILDPKGSTWDSQALHISADICNASDSANTARIIFLGEVLDENRNPINGRTIGAYIDINLDRR